MEVTGHAPTFASGFAVRCMSAAAADLFNPESIHELESVKAHRETVVDLACKDPALGFYSGDEQSRQSVEIKFGEFVDLYQATYANQSHWLQTVDNLEFYLCQCPIAVYQQDDTCAKAKLPGIMREFCIPECLTSQALSQVNLWMSVRASRTSLHYDAYRNVLVVLHGCKRVTLYPPSQSAYLYPHPVYSQSANHSRVNVAEPDLQAHPEFSKATAQRFEVTAGDALFIPEGWWHQVDSDAFTIAVNFWFDGSRKRLIEDPDMAAYYARVLVADMVKQESARYLQSLRSAHSSKRDGRSHQDTVDMVLHATEQAEREQILLAIDGAELRTVQKQLARDHCAVWRSLLEHASLEFVGILTDHWDQWLGDSEDADTTDSLAAIFAALGDHEERIRLMLLLRKDDFQREMGARVLADTFGCCAGSDSQ